MHSAMAFHSMRCTVSIILIRMMETACSKGIMMRLPLHVWSLYDCLNLLWDVKIVTIPIVQRSHELRMAQAPDFVAKLVDDISFLDAPAISIEVFQSNDIL